MKDLFLSIVNIFRWAGKIFTIIRNTIFNLILVGIVIGIASAFLLSKTEEQPLLMDNTALILNLNGNIVEEKQYVDPVSEMMNEAMGFENPYQEILLQDILDTIDYAATDKDISYIRLDVQKLGGVGLPQLSVIGDALTEFKKSGKKVIAAEDYFTQNQYYLASFADEIIINPMGGVDLHGFGVYRLYFKDVLDKLKINYHIFRVGTHKSALEPVMRNSMSYEDRMQSKIWLTALWSNFTKDIIAERNLSDDAVMKYTNNAPNNLSLVGGDTAKLALQTGLVDKIMTRIELQKYLGSLSAEDIDGKARTINMTDYLTTIYPSYTDPTESDNHVGLIVAQGTILPGQQPAGTIGGDSLAETLQTAREDDSIKAVVLRIDSGGGSAFASEIIRQEVLALKEAGKKVVVSMGNVAASGGYWIAAPADEIWAANNTITGSIGIFGAIPTFEDSLAELGVYSDGVGTTRIASGLNLTKTLPPELKQTIQLTVEYGYEQFLTIVAEGRNLDMEEVKKLAEGKVYDGTTAHTLGLIDNLGSLDDALASAAKLAGIDKDYSTIYVTRPLTLKEKFFEQFRTSILSLLAKQLESEILTYFNKSLAPVKDLLLLKDPKGVYAHSLIFETSFQ